MSERDTAPSSPGQAGAIIPRYGGQSLLNVPATVGVTLGATLAGLAPPLDPAVLPTAMLDGVEAVLLVVVDGLGARQLEAGMAAGDAPTFAGLRDRSRSGAADVSFQVITSVFPSSTIPALTTLATGLPPSAHGLLGWTVYLEEFGEAAELARWGPATGRGSYQDERLGGHDPVRFFGVETLPRRLDRAGIASAVVCPAVYRGSGLSTMTFQGAEFLDVHAASSVLVRCEQRLRERPAGQRLYLYAYWDLLDTVSHHDGPLGMEHGAELSALDLALRRWLERHHRRGDLLLLLTADHGHVPSDPRRAVRLDHAPDLLRELLCQCTGERRMAYLHPRPGRRDAVRAYCVDRLADAADWIDAGQVIDRGWLGPGPLSPAARRRLGDGVLVARGDHQFVYPLGPPAPGREPPVFAGNHGAFDAREMLVPLLAVRL